MIKSFASNENQTKYEFYLTVGPSVDPSGVTMVDSIKVYVKTKEAFGWPEDSEDFPEAPAQKTPVPVATGPTVSATSENESTVVVPVQLTSMDR